MNTFTITITRHAADDYTASISGVTYGPGNDRLQVVSMTSSALVLKYKGASDNNGSRNSGLRSYTPGGVIVYTITEVNPVSASTVRVRAQAVTGWDVVRGQKSDVPARTWAQVTDAQLPA